MRLRPHRPMLILSSSRMISATRAYEAGVTAINSAKQMQARALDIGRG